jgi:hypothetical protein
MVLKTHWITHKDRKSTTQAYAIEIPSHTTPQMILILKEVTKNTKDFVTFRMRRHNPAALQGAICLSKSFAFLPTSYRHTQHWCRSHVLPHR